VFIDQGERNMIRKDADSDITESTHTTESRYALSALTPAPVKMKMRSVGKTVSADEKAEPQRCHNRSPSSHRHRCWRNALMGVPHLCVMQ
jgi:hypothetical protein